MCSDKAELDRLGKKIAECQEQIEKFSQNIEDESFVQAYRRFLHYYQDKRAIVADRIGRKKK